jgi:nucleotide-binding universal stress UspA family protein
MEDLIQTPPILVATDFSPDSEAALLWACEFAACVDAPVLVLHVVHDPAEASGFYRSEEGEALEPIMDVAERLMLTFLSGMRDANPGVAPLQSATTELVAGLPPGRIVEVAEREGAQLIVIGSRGLTGLSHILVGSVAERVAQLAPMPVVIVKRQAEV